jgi:endonuclease YncB( thermonuclease family)
MAETTANMGAKTPVGRARGGRLTALSVAALLAVLAVSGAAGAQDAALVKGPATVIDASHVDVGGRRFKLYGIDAPDLDQTCETAQHKDYPCGAEARAALVELAKGATVSCLPRGPNEFGETMAICSAGRTDLARALIDAGWAIADRARTLYYERAEETARTTRHGLWQGPFVLPAQWRTGERVPQGRTRGVPGLFK